MKIGSRYIKKLEEELYWKTKSEEVIKISRMNDNHLINAINLIQKNSKKISERIRIIELKNIPNGDFTNSVNDAIDEMINKLVTDEDLDIIRKYYKPYKNMLNEAVKRGLYEDLCEHCNNKKELELVKDYYSEGCEYICNNPNCVITKQ